MSALAIRVSGLGKRYRLGRDPYTTVREAIVRRVVPGRRGARHPRAEHSGWALRDVTFDVAAGEVVGVVGRNGAGKSTLLKVLARITRPTVGRAELFGRVGALLEVGTGFSRELTGRENVFLNGAILGMGRREIAAKLDDIVAFAEIEAFLDTPVKHYSTGMYLRLAFSVAAHLEPEILFVDEVLAVGDVAFQRKCLGKMNDVARGGRTVIFVSHNLGSVLGLCTRALLLDGGRLLSSGPPADVVGTYMRLNEMVTVTPLVERRDRRGEGFARVTALELHPLGGAPRLRCGDGLKVRLHYAAERALEGAAFMIGIYGSLNQPLYRLDSEAAGGVVEVLPRSGVFECETAPLHLTAGRYFVNVAIMMRGAVIDHVEQAATFDVDDDDFYGTGKMPSPYDVPCLLPQRWRLKPS